MGIYLPYLLQSLSPRPSATDIIRQKRLPLFFDDVPFVCDIVLFRISNFKRYYSSFRETPSRILDLRRRVFPVRRARPNIILLFLLSFDFHCVTWELHVLLLAREPESWNDDGVVTMTEGGRKINESEERIFSVFSKEVETVF